jgi:hypothetical protein
MQKITKQEAEERSKPHLCKFDPYVVPMQGQVVDLIHSFDYSTGTPEILLSGSYGSSKSILMAHLAVTHCLNYKGARVCLARKAMPDLKRTIYQEVLEHISEDMIEGKHFTTNTTNGSVKFANGSEIISISWADRKYKKGRSLKLSALIFEEITENDDDDMEAFKTLKARLRRIPNVPENFLIAATNPDAPTHWVYKYFIESQPHPTRFVFYSITKDNPFLDPIYIDQLERDLDPISARRYLRGEWIEVNTERIYSCYNSQNQFKKRKYEINRLWPIRMAFDFNIGHGKPMSSAIGQYDPVKDVWHWFDKVIVEGAYTGDVMREWEAKGIFNELYQYVIHGDATGEARDTRSILSDYDIIKRELSRLNMRFKMEVPRANPPIKTRHNMVNGYCLNEKGETRLFIYEGCDKIDEGFRLTQLKKGGQFIEDDSKDYQHITTAIGYAICSEKFKGRALEPQRRM